MSASACSETCSCGNGNYSGIPVYVNFGKCCGTDNCNTGSFVATATCNSSDNIRNNLLGIILILILYFSF